MTWLSILLVIKIAVTAPLAAAPFLVLSTEKLGKLTRMEAASGLFFRLYGVAMVAILSAYGFGIATAQSGEFPWFATVMGVLSNGGAVIALGTSGALARTAPVAGFLTLVTAGLIAAMAFPIAALGSAF